MVNSMVISRQKLNLVLNALASDNLDAFMVTTIFQHIVDNQDEFVDVVSFLAISDVVGEEIVTLHKCINAIAEENDVVAYFLVMRNALRKISEVVRVESSKFDAIELSNPEQLSTYVLSVWKQIFLYFKEKGVDLDEVIKQETNPVLYKLYNQSFSN